MLNLRVCLVYSLIAFSASSIASQTQTQKPNPSMSPFSGSPQMSPAQRENFPPQVLNELSAIKTAALTDDYACRQVAQLTENIGPRLSGSPQAKAAVDYGADQPRHLGLGV